MNFKVQSHLNIFQDLVLKKVKRGQTIDLLFMSAVKSKLIRCQSADFIPPRFMWTSVSCTFWVVCSTQDTFNVILHEGEVLALDKVDKGLKMSARVFMNSRAALCPCWISSNQSLSAGKGIKPSSHNCLTLCSMSSYRGGKAIPNHDAPSTMLPSWAEVLVWEPNLVKHVKCYFPHCSNSGSSKAETFLINPQPTSLHSQEINISVS